MGKKKRANTSPPSKNAVIPEFRNRGSSGVDIKATGFPLTTAGMTFLRQVLAVAVLAVVTCIVYYPSLRVPFLLDDYGKIVRNPDIKSLDNLPGRLIYPYESPPNFHRNDPSRPLTYLTLTLNYYFNQLEPYGYHAANMAIHLLVVVLVFILGSLLFPLIGAGGMTLPFLSALVFAVHPIHVNVVTYVIGRAASLAAIFYLSSVILFILARRGRKRAAIGSLICFILSLASNQLALTLPAIIGLTEYCFFSGLNIRTTLANWKKYAAYWMVLTLYLGMRFIYFGKLGDVEATVLVTRPSDYFLTEYVVLWKYVGLFLVPAGLSFEHLYSPLKSLADPHFLVASVLLVTTFVVIKRRLNAAHPSVIFMLFCWLWFLIILLPTSSFFPTTATMAENRLYIPSIGLCLALTCVIFMFVRRIASQRLHRTLLLILVGSYSAALGAMTFQRNVLYQDPIKIWTAVIRQYPEHERAHKNLALAFYTAGKLSEAVEETQKAIALDPDDIDARNNLAAALYGLKRYQESLAAFQEIVKKMPDYAPAYTNMGMVYEQLNDLNSAIKAYQTALRLNPNLMEALNNLAGVYLVKGNVQEATKLYEAALKIDPNNAEILKNYRLAVAHLKKS